jgi:hypothetical protein
MSPALDDSVVTAGSSGISAGRASFAGEHRATDTGIQLGEATTADKKASG